MLSGSCFMFMFSQVNIFISSEGIGAWWSSAGDGLLERALGPLLPLTIGKDSYSFMPKSPCLKHEGTCLEDGSKQKYVK